MKVIFLDIDGVLNSTKSVMARVGLLNMSDAQRDAYTRLMDFMRDDGLPYGPNQSLETVDPAAVGLLNRLLRSTDAFIVLSSTHRGYFYSSLNLPYASRQHVSVLGTYLCALGIRAGKLLSITPKLHTLRGVEVKQWLEEHPEVTDYVILDDSTDFLPGQNFVRVDATNGFCFEDFKRASEFLGTPYSEIITLDERIMGS